MSCILNRTVVTTMFELYCGQKFLPCFEICSEDAEHATGHHGHVRTMDSARRHALVRAFDDNRHA